MKKLFILIFLLIFLFCTSLKMIGSHEFITDDLKSFKQLGYEIIKIDTIKHQRTETYYIHFK